MSPPKQYMAGSVPRFIRQTKLGYLQLNSIVGSRIIRGDKGANLIFDIIMLPVPQFQRMRTNVGMQQVAAPALQRDGGLSASFVIADAKHVTVPEDEPDPEFYAREYFIREFGLLEPKPPDQTPSPPAGSAEPKQSSDVFKAAKNSTLHRFSEDEEQ